MSDPVPAVVEADAVGEAAEIFDDIRRVLRVGVVNLIWRHLATLPGALPWVWESVRPLYAGGAVEREARVLRSSIELPALPAALPAVFAAIGLSNGEMAQIHAILAAYDRTNAMALIALTAVQRRLAGAPADVGMAAALSTDLPAEQGDDLTLPKLLDLSEMSPASATLIAAINRFGARDDSPVLASMYRHLAHWPAYLALAWATIAPLAGDGRLEGAISDTLAMASARASHLPTSLLVPKLALAPAVRDDVSRALGRFTGDVIARMVVICALLRRQAAPDYAPGDR